MSEGIYSLSLQPGVVMLQDQLQLHGLEKRKNGSVGWIMDTKHHPRNWPVWRKTYDTSLIIFLDFFTLVSTSLNGTSQETNTFNRSAIGIAGVSFFFDPERSQKSWLLLRYRRPSKLVQSFTLVALWQYFSSLQCKKPQVSFVDEVLSLAATCLVKDLVASFSRRIRRALAEKVCTSLPRGYTLSLALWWLQYHRCLQPSSDASLQAFYHPFPQALSLGASRIFSTQKHAYGLSSLG